MKQPGRRTAIMKSGTLESYHVEDPRGQPVLKQTFILTKMCYLVYICTNIVYAAMAVDEECAEKGIVYKRWVPNPDLEGHISIRPFLDSTVVSDEQKVPGHCLLCPKKKYFLDMHSANYHYTHVHIAYCLVIDDYKILMCKCSDIRSRGSDYCARNRHYHCYECYQPFDQPTQLA